MTTFHIPPALVDVIGDLARQLAPEERFQRLLKALRELFACDAAALLRLEGDALQPVAVTGLAEETLGRRFVVDQHPRLARILNGRGPVRFTDAELPDPYDGLVGDSQVGEAHGTLPVHDCLGATLHLEQQPWGVLTLDALAPGAFDAIDPASLDTFLRLTEACVRAAVAVDSLQLRLEREREVSREQAAAASRELLGRSPAMQRLREEIATVAPSDLGVLILGETGVGKELVAHQLYAASRRAQAPLIHVNCAALPEHLAESELFGHRRGAFTGATEDRRGKFELADGGTLFLDEVGELPLALQAKLLRVLQNGELQRPGSDQLLRVDVRVLAATNRDLAREVAEGRFRADLYHRLGVYPITVPPLRERGRDILTVAGAVLEENRHRLGLRQLQLSPEARRALLAYDWPGNVRELQYLLSRAALRVVAAQQRGGAPASRWATIGVGDLDLNGGGTVTAPVPATTVAASGESLREALDRFQQEWVSQVLARQQGNLAAAAREAGMDRSNFHRLARRLGLI